MSVVDMEYEDCYHESTVESESTVYSSPRAKRKAMEEMLKLDSGYRSIGSKKDKLVYYATNIVAGNPIRNAVTGIREYNLKIGDPVAESQFFKIIYAGNGISNTTGPDSLYYDSPEQCERHMKINLRQPVKDKWRKKYDLAIQSNNTDYE